MIGCGAAGWWPPGPRAGDAALAPAEGPGPGAPAHYADHQPRPWCSECLLPEDRPWWPRSCRPRAQGRTAGAPAGREARGAGAGRLNAAQPRHRRPTGGPGPHGIARRLGWRSRRRMECVDISHLGASSLWPAWWPCKTANWTRPATPLQDPDPGTGARRLRGHGEVVGRRLAGIAPRPISWCSTAARVSSTRPWRGGGASARAAAGHDRPGQGQGGVPTTSFCRGARIPWPQAHAPELLLLMSSATRPTASPSLPPFAAQEGADQVHPGGGPRSGSQAGETAAQGLRQPGGAQGGRSGRYARRAGLDQATPGGSRTSWPRLTPQGGESRLSQLELQRTTG